MTVHRRPASFETKFPRRLPGTKMALAFAIFFDDSEAAPEANADRRVVSVSLGCHARAHSQPGPNPRNPRAEAHLHQAAQLAPSSNRSFSRLLAHPPRWKRSFWVAPKSAIASKLCGACV